MNILQFTQRFPDEKSCRTHLKEQRLKQGIICPKCKRKTKHYWLNKVEKFQCAHCETRTNLRAGTLMEKSKVPVRIWFIVIHLMTTTKKPFSALELQRQTGYKFYEPIWYMMQKIRRAMGKRDRLYKLKGSLEMDDAFFEVVDVSNSFSESDEPLKRGRGSQDKQKVLIMVESTPNPQQKDKHKKKRAMGYVKMVIMDELTNVGINYEVTKSVDEDASVLSDKFRGYSKLTEVVKEHEAKVVPPKDSMKVLPWVHTVIANCKRELLGVHHSVGKAYLQNYLDEFCWKTNRRNFQSDLFDRMIVAGASDVWY